MLEVVEVDIQVMLSGPYNNLTHQMGKALNTLGYLPLASLIILHHSTMQVQRH
ncbi:MAG: hypothetical protein IPI60_10205 [Saprospiraceae bacterium]|nr:hypothetical protein [Saprospiraceae bacterium]